MLQETSYGIVRRLDFIQSCVQDVFLQLQRKLTVADIGCGNGELLTIPLAKALNNEIVIRAYDPDESSIRHLQEQILVQNLMNLEVSKRLDFLEKERYDIVIASEVLEHVQNPFAFLKWAAAMLRPGSLMILTIPNGYGPFEWETLLFNSLEVIGVIPILRRITRLIHKWAGSPRKLILKKDTFAISPHIQFFSLNDIYSLMEASGFRLEKLEGKIFAAGPFSDRLLNIHPSLIELNNWLGYRLPLSLVSDWMIVAKYVDRVEPTNQWFPRLNLYTRYKRFINYRSK